MGNIKRNAIYNILLSVSQILFPLITFPYVSRILGPQGIGNVSFVDSVTQYFILAAALGIPIYGVREIAKVKAVPTQRSKVFSELVTIHISTTIVSLVLYCGVFFSFIKFQEYQGLFFISLGLLFFQVFVMEWLFQGLEEFPYITKRTLLVRTGSVLAIFLVVKTAQDVLWYYGVTLATLIINVILNVRYASHFVSFKTYRFKQAIRCHWKPLLYIFSLGMVTSVYTVLDTALLGFLSDTEQVGYYATSMRLIKLIVTIFVAFATVMIPSLSKAFYERDDTITKQLLKKSFGYMVLLCVPASIGLLVVAPLVISLYAGPAFSEAIISLRILAPSIICISLSNIFGMQILNPSNNERLFFKAAMVGMMVSLLINFSLIPFLGQKGAAISALVTELVVLILLIIYATRKVSFNPQWYLLLQAIFASVSFIPIYWFINSLQFSTMVSLLLVMCCSLLSYIFIQIFAFQNPYIRDLLKVSKEKLRSLSKQ